MAILMDHLGFDQAKVLLEHKVEGDSKNLYMNGVFIQGDVKNHNNRIYPINEIRNAVNSINDRIRQTNGIMGELDHPAELNINLDRVSHIITEMYMDGPNGCGKLKILPTAMGNIAKTLLESGVKLGVSSRGSGNVMNNGNVSDFEIITVDIVANPSAPNAYPKAIYEALNARRGNITYDLATAVKHDPKAQKYLQKELLTWLDSLK